METFSSVFTSSLFEKLAAPLLAICVAVFILFVFWRRADSLHAVWEKVWRLVAGSTDVQEPRLRAFMQEMRDLEKFRLIYGLKVKSMADMHRLISWVRRYDLDITILQKSRRWVDISKPEFIKQPPKSFFYWNGFWFVFAGVLAEIAVLVSTSSPLFQMRASNAWFAVGETTISTPFRGTKFELNQCPAFPEAARRAFGFAKEEVQALCIAHTDGSLKKRASAAATEQSRLGAGVSVIAFLWLLVIAMRVRSGQTARSLAKRMRQPEARPLPSSSPPPAG